MPCPANYLQYMAFVLKLRLVNRMVHSVNYLKICQPFSKDVTLGSTTMSFLYDQYGKRKYLTIAERTAFLEAARQAGDDTFTFCAMLAYTGARISEVLALIPGRFDLDDQVIVIQCLKKRRPGTNRVVPVPALLLREIDQIHMIRRKQQTANANEKLIWPWCRTTAWKRVKDVMKMAGLSGPHASPKGLRHSFGVCALQSHAPINMVQKWLGHARITTTAIYADAVGEEERQLAENFWRTFV